MVASRAPPAGERAHNPSMCPDWELNQRPFSWQAGTSQGTLRSFKSPYSFYKTPKYPETSHSLPELPYLSSHLEPSSRKGLSITPSCFHLLIFHSLQLCFYSPGAAALGKPGNESVSGRGALNVLEMSTQKRPGKKTLALASAQPQTPS